METPQKKILDWHGGNYISIPEKNIFVYVLELFDLPLHLQNLIFRKVLTVGLRQVTVKHRTSSAALLIICHHRPLTFSPDL